MKIKILPRPLLFINEMIPNCVVRLAEWQADLIIISVTDPISYSALHPKRFAKRTYNVQAKFHWDKRMTLAQKIIIIIVIIIFTLRKIWFVPPCPPPTPYYYCVRCVPVCMWSIFSRPAHRQLHWDSLGLRSQLTTASPTRMSGRRQ